MAHYSTMQLKFLVGAEGCGGFWRAVSLFLSWTSPSGHHRGAKLFLLFGSGLKYPCEWWLPARLPSSLSPSSSRWQRGSLGKSSSARAWAPGAPYRLEVFSIWMNVTFTAVTQKPQGLEENFRTSCYFFIKPNKEGTETKSVFCSPRVELQEFRSAQQHICLPQAPKVLMDGGSHGQVGTAHCCLGSGSPRELRGKSCMLLCLVVRGMYGTQQWVGVKAAAWGSQPY